MPARTRSVTSRVSVKSQTVLPREVRQRLGIAPGDQVRYILDDSGVRLERVDPREDDDPFASFAEWSTAADEKAYGDL